MAAPLVQSDILATVERAEDVVHGGRARGRSSGYGTSVFEYAGVEELLE